MPLVQMMLLGVIVSGFIIFMITLFCVSIYVSAGSRRAEQPIARTVTPARRFDETSHQS